MYKRTCLWVLSIIAVITYLFPVQAQEIDKDKKGYKSSEASSYKKSKGMTLKAAIAKALRHSPYLKASQRGVAAAKGERLQAGKWTNPEFGLEVENFGGSGANRGFDSAETTYSVTQKFEIGGKISSRENAANKSVEISKLDYQAAALDIIRDVTIAYAELVAAEENVNLASQQKTLAEKVIESVSKRVDAAAVPLLQKNRAEVEKFSTAVALDKASLERNVARKKLAVLMGTETFTQSIDGSDFYVTSAPYIKVSAHMLKSNPDLKKLQVNLEKFKAQLELERANAVPDPTLNVGVRDSRESGDHTYVVGVSIPVPLFNLNEGNIEKASQEMNKTELENRQTQLNMTSELTQAFEKMKNTYLQSRTIKDQIIPSADKAFSLALEGYNLGRFSYLDVLDAQRSLFGIKQQYIEALKDYHASRAQIERLTGTYLQNIKNMGADHAQ